MTHGGKYSVSLFRNTVLMTHDSLSNILGAVAATKSQPASPKLPAQSEGEVSEFETIWQSLAGLAVQQTQSGETPPDGNAGSEDVPTVDETEDAALGEDDTDLLLALDAMPPEDAAPAQAPRETLAPRNGETLQQATENSGKTFVPAAPPQPMAEIQPSIVDPVSTPAQTPETASEPAEAQPQTASLTAQVMSQNAAPLAAPATQGSLAPADSTRKNEMRRELSKPLTPAQAIIGTGMPTELEPTAATGALPQDNEGDAILPVSLDRNMRPEAASSPPPQAPAHPFANSLATAVPPAAFKTAQTDAQNMPIAEVSAEEMRPGTTGPVWSGTAVSAAAMQSDRAPRIAIDSHVASQVATAIRPLRPGTTEIALSPPELGNVRITVSAQESGMLVAINAERPETYDLLRRNIEMLNQELRSTNDGEIQFTFSQSGAETPDDAHDERGTHTQTHETNDAIAVSVAPARHILSSGLDIRI